MSYRIAKQGVFWPMDLSNLSIRESRLLGMLIAACSTHKKSCDCSPCAFTFWFQANFHCLPDFTG